MEIAQAPNFDFIIVNRHFHEALRELESIVVSQRLRLAAQRRAHPEVFEALGIDAAAPAQRN